MKQQGRRAMIALCALALVLPLVSGCSVWRDIRSSFGYKGAPPQITETHLAPCLQPHRGSAGRDCSGDITTYTSRAAGQRQQF